MKKDNDVGKLGSLALNKLDLEQAYRLFDSLDSKRGTHPEESCIAQHVAVPMDKVDSAINFWKPLYFNVTTEGRLLSGIETYELGDPKHRVHPDKAPYIAQCNLMALEAIKMMGDHWPTVEDPQDFVFGSEREKEVAKFWKDTFAPTLFQTQWAWTGVMAVLAGEPMATRELLYDYKDQLP